jgi:hypothetical protein
MSLKISMTLESYDEQHVWRIADVRCGLDKGLVCGQTGLVQVQLMLTQHLSWKRPFKATISVDFKPTFRRVMFELTHRGQTGLLQ